MRVANTAAVVIDDDRIGASQRADRFAEAAERQPAIVKIARRDDDQIHVPRDLSVLEPVVEQNDAGGEGALG